MRKHINEEKQEQRNMLLALLLVIASFFVLNFFFSPSDKTNQISVPLTVSENLSPTTQPIIPPVVQEATKKEPLKSIPVRNDLIEGAISLSGEVNKLILLNYREKVSKSSPHVTLLSQDSWTSLNWFGDDTVKMPSSTSWETKQTELTPFSPVILTLTSSDIRIERKIEIDNAYLFTITDTVYNLKDAPIFMELNGKIHKTLKTLPVASTAHEGLIGLFNNKLVEERYGSLKESLNENTLGGWIGITDKYWQSVYIFDQSTPVKTIMKKEDSLYTSSFQTDPILIKPSASITQTTRLFAGAKTLKLINDYQSTYNIPKFDLTIDFGWFYFLTKPFLYFLIFLQKLVGNMGIAILLFATLLRIALLPIATKSYISMAKMRQIQPKIKELQARFKDNRLVLQQEMMNLYRREKVNPAGGCLPILIQIPIFFALYKVLSVSILMRQAPFFGWIHDLSAPDPSSVFTLFGLLNWPIPSFLNIGIWPVLMGITMYIQQKLNPAPTDKTQETVFKFIPIIFTFMLGNFASGLVIYWTWSNILSIAQQKYIMKKVGVK